MFDGRQDMEVSERSDDGKEDYRFYGRVRSMNGEWSQQSARKKIAHRFTTKLDHPLLHVQHQQ
jgi:hypothetical protein